MNPGDMIERAFRDGVGVVLDGGKIRLDGPPPAVEQWQPRFDQHQKAVVRYLQDVDRLQDKEIGSESWLVDEMNHQENHLSKRFVDAYQDQLRFVPKWGRWLRWDGKRWLVDDNGIKVLEASRQYSQSLWREIGGAMKSLDEKAIFRLLKFVKRANNSSVLGSVIHLSRSDARIVVSHEDLNKESGILNVQNGILNLSTGELSPHDPSRNITQLASVEYHSNADCPQFKAALELIFDDDGEVIRYVQQLLGYAISGTCSEHILPIAYGSGCNGKSTLTNVILGLLGDYAGLANESLLLGTGQGHPTEKLFLYQKRFVPISEPDSGAQMKESRVKELTGDSTITARGMKQDFWSFQRSHTFWMSTNHLPTISGSDEGIWRRIKLIPFRVDLRSKTTPEADLDKRLLRDEGPGILRWLVDGYRDYLANGFIEPTSVMTATESYRCEEDEIGRFIQERCYISSNGITTAEDLWQTYQAWRGKMNRTNFGREMANRFHKETPNSGSYRRKTIYRGVAIISANEMEPEQQEAF